MPLSLLTHFLPIDQTLGEGSGGNLKKMEDDERDSYTKLLKKYRNAESDRKSYAMETAAIIKK